MTAIYMEHRFKKSMDESLEKLRFVLQSSRRPTYPGEVDHSYSDKYSLAELLVNTSIAAQFATLQHLGLDEPLALQKTMTIKIVGKVHNKGGFLQNGVVQKLQINEPGESNYVFGIMKGILEKLQKTRAELDAEEKKKVSMDNAFMTTKKGQVESARTERGEKDVKLTETRIALVKAQAQLKRSAKQIAEVTQILDGTNKECDSKKIAWADRQKDRKKIGRASCRERV